MPIHPVCPRPVNAYETGEADASPVSGYFYGRSDLRIDPGRKLDFLLNWRFSLALWVGSFIAYENIAGGIGVKHENSLGLGFAPAAF